MMHFMNTIGLILAVSTVILAVVLLRGSTRLMKMIEDEQRDESKEP